jgi:hypothetical protein
MLPRRLLTQVDETEARRLLDNLTGAMKMRPLHVETLTTWRTKAETLLATVEFPPDHPLQRYSSRIAPVIAHSEQFYGKLGAPTFERAELSQ